MNDRNYHSYCSGGFLPDDIVISGIAGRFPLCDNVGELHEALMTQKDLLVQSNKRYEKGAYDLPFSSSGLVNNLEKFDADFFNVPAFTADAIEPGQRKLLEVSYEAMVDAGYEPFCELKGSNIGVYTGITNEDSKEVSIEEFQPRMAVGYLRTMNANRCSSVFDFHGPSFTVDSACSTSFVALCIAVKDLQNGLVDAALVNSAELCICPTTTSRYHSCGMISETATCTPFDAKANGIVRAEAITAMFVQKASDARRAYATVLGIKQSSAGHVPEGIFLPSWIAESRLFEDVLRETRVDITDIDFIESHGTGTFKGDPIEVKALEVVYCKDRKKPLYIGSIKSNVGHTEASSGSCGAIKAIMAFETGIIPPNCRFGTPNPECPALVRGDIIVVSDPIPLTTPYIPISSFGIGGSLTHAILKQNPVESSSSFSNLPRLVLYPGTTEDAVHFVFDYVESHPKLTDEFFALLNKSSYSSVSTKPFRGYALLQNEQAVIQVKKCRREMNREVWFIMTGMGCQWPGMGLEMMQIDVFAKSMQKSAAVLKLCGIDLFDLLQKDKKHLQTSRSITPAFVSIVAIQIALVDLLKSLKIEPDGIVGHSTGELMCAYADGCCTAEQTILSAYWRGRSVEEANLVEGAMAAIGLTWEETVRRCPTGVYASCHNADDSITISGLKGPVDKFVSELQKEGVFARVVDAYDYAFHCEYVWPAAKTLKSALLDIITDPQPRSKRWLSSSYSEKEWDTDNCRLAGAEYFVHNLMSTVRFNEVLKKIPKNAIVIEIGPHFLLQSILKRSIGSDASYMGLMKRNDNNNIGFFMESLGKLYVEGLNPKTEYIYPPVKFPVPRNTPLISDLIKWDHSKSWQVPIWRPISGSYRQTFHIDGAHNYLMDHFIDGKALFPATGYIFLAWNALAKKVNKTFHDLDVVIEDFKIHRAILLNRTGAVSFSVTMLDATGSFEIQENKSLVASGRIYEMQNISFCEPSPARHEGPESTLIPGEDIYNELRIFGYEYGPAFRRIAEVNLTGSEGFVEWKDNWITFLDALLLFYMFTGERSKFVLPTGALTFKICPGLLKNSLEKHPSKDLTVSLVNFHADTMICRTEGVEIKRLEVDTAPQHLRPDNNILEEYKFLPYVHQHCSSEKQQIITKYQIACNKLLSDLEKIFNKNLSSTKFHAEHKIDFDIEDYLNNLSKEHVLLHTLTKIADVKIKTHLIQKGKEIFSEFYPHIGKDILNTFLANDYCLKIVLDIVSENSIRKLNILEINKNFITLLPIVVECFEKFSSIKFKNKCLVCDKNEICEDMLQKYNIQQYSYDKFSTIAEDKSQDVIISSVLTGTKDEIEEHIQFLSSSITEKGFIILFHKNLVNRLENLIASLAGDTINIVPHTILEKLFDDKNLVIVSKISDDIGGNLYLLKHAEPQQQLTLIRMSESGEWFEELKSSVLNSSDNIWLLSEDSPDSGVIGMVNCLRNEPGGERLRCVFITEKAENLPSFDFAHPFYQELLRKDLLMNVWKDGSWGSFRHTIIGKDRIDQEEVDYSYLNIRRYGDLSSLEWIESPIGYAGVPDDDIAYICYSALNFKDIMLATGKLSEKTAKIHSGKKLFEGCSLGLEFSGVTKNGKKFAGMSPSMGIATAVPILPETCVAIPDDWSLQDAATVPVVYMTCYYGLIIRAGLQPKESVLIHSGTGGIGLAAINIALGMHCEIFTTVGTEEKRKFLMEMFPQINSENIGCSRNTTFESMIMRATKGKGVDVVLNSLADDKFYASIRCVAKHGRYVEIGKYDLALDHKIGLKFFLKNVSFHGVFLDEIFVDTEHNKRVCKETLRLIQDGIKRGIVKPLKSTVFNHDEAEKAFRYMTSGSHIGKVLLKIRDEEELKCSISKLRRPATPVTYFYSRKVYIIVGGLGGFGIEVARWLLSKGATNIVLTSRYGARTQYHHFCIKRWKDDGYNVVVSTKDVSIQEECSSLLRDVEKIGPVGGIFNSAVVLDDAFLEKCTMKGFKEVCAPKADATRNLDMLSRSVCKELDHFVCFSSISCGRGNAGQMNYGYANSVMERICERRRADGLPGLAIQWGIIGEVGIVHRNMGDDAMIAGVGAQRVKSCLQVLDMACKMKRPVVCSYVLKDSTLQKGNMEDTLQQLAKAFGLKDVSEFNPNRCFSEMGVDSMTGVELKYILEKSCGVTFTMKEIQEMKLADVKEYLEKIESQKKDKSSALVSTAKGELPKSFIHLHPVQPLNEIKTGSPVFILDIDCNEISHLRALGSALKHPAFALLWSKDTPMSDLETVASWFLKKIKEMYEGEIHIIAHCSASTLGLEMVLQNWKCERNIKTFAVINGSTYLAKTANEKINISEIDILWEFLDTFVPGASENRLAYTLEQQIRVAVDCLFNHAPDKNELCKIIHSTVKKLKVISDYKPEGKLSKDLLIIEDYSQLLANDVAEVKSELSKICSGKVTIERIHGAMDFTKEGIQNIVSVLNSLV